LAEHLHYVPVGHELPNAGNHQIANFLKNSVELIGFPALGQCHFSDLILRQTPQQTFQVIIQFERIPQNVILIATGRFGIVLGC
jgi:hypothetical protein